jgi:hypothetical protein
MAGSVREIGDAGVNPATRYSSGAFNLSVSYAASDPGPRLGTPRQAPGLRCSIQALIELSNHPTRLGDNLTGRGKRSAVISRQRVVELKPVRAKTSGFRMRRSLVAIPRFSVDI